VSSVSWLSKHKCADYISRIRDDGVSQEEFTRRSSQLRQSVVSDSAQLRQEALTHFADETFRNSPVTWDTAVARWHEWYAESIGMDMTFKNADGDTAKKQGINRFTPEKQEERYAKLNDLESNLREEWGDDLTTFLLGFTASNSPYGDLISPIDHFEALTSSRDAIRRELYRQLDGRDFEYVWMVDAHESGYLHYHLAVFVRGDVPKSIFEPVLRRHVDNCEFAEMEAHKPQETVTRRREITNLSAYMMSYMTPDEISDPRTHPLEWQMLYAVLWLSNSRMWSSSQGAKRYMASGEYDSDDDWELDKIEYADGTEVKADEMRVDREGAVTYLVEWEPPPF